MKVKNVVIGVQAEQYENCLKFIELTNKKNVKVILLKADDIFKIDKETYFEVFFPDTKNVVSNNKINNNSLVMKLVYKDFSMLFTGDIEEEAENVLLKKYNNKLKGTVLKVAHHGSKTSSTISFLNVVNPKIALIGVGVNNTFGHPSSITLKNLKSMGCNIYRTDQNGEISIRVNSKGKVWIYKMLN